MDIDWSMRLTASVWLEMDGVWMETDSVSFNIDSVWFEFETDLLDIDSVWLQTDSVLLEIAWFSFFLINSLQSFCFFRWFYTCHNTPTSLF